MFWFLLESWHFQPLQRGIKRIIITQKATFKPNLAIEMETVSAKTKQNTPLNYPKGVYECLYMCAVICLYLSQKLFLPYKGKLIPTWSFIFNLKFGLLNGNKTFIKTVNILSKRYRKLLCIYLHWYCLWYTDFINNLYKKKTQAKQQWPK